MKPLDIVLVEDNPGDVELIRIMFQDSHIVNQLVVIDNGKDVLPYLESVARLPDLILLDLGLPCVSGRDLLAHIKANPKYCNVFLLVVTESNAVQDITTSYTRGADAYLFKPLGIEQMFAAIQAISGLGIMFVRREIVV